MIFDSSLWHLYTFTTYTTVNRTAGTHPPTPSTLICPGDGPARFDGGSCPYLFFVACPETTWRPRQRPWRPANRRFDAVWPATTVVRLRAAPAPSTAEPGGRSTDRMRRWGRRRRRTWQRRCRRRLGPRRPADRTCQYRARTTPRRRRLRIWREITEW